MDLQSITKLKCNIRATVNPGLAGLVSILNRASVSTYELRCSSGRMPCVWTGFYYRSAEGCPWGSWDLSSVFEEDPRTTADACSRSAYSAIGRENVRNVQADAWFIRHGRLGRCLKSERCRSLYEEHKQLPTKTSAGKTGSEVVHTRQQGINWKWSPLYE